MKLTTTLIFILFIIIQYSCKSKSSNEYKIGEHKLQMTVPSTFKKMSTEEANKFSEDGIKLLKQNGFTGFSDQKSMFHFRRGEFSLLKAKRYKLDQYSIENYKTLWKNMKGIAFDELAKRALEIEKTTIDSISRIEKINGIEFYVYETNIYSLDLNNNKWNMKHLRYSTPVDNQDLVIDASFINERDGVDIIKSLKTINITE